MPFSRRNLHRLSMFFTAHLNFRLNYSSWLLAFEPFIAANGLVSSLTELHSFLKVSMHTVSFGSACPPISNVSCEYFIFVSKFFRQGSKKGTSRAQSSAIASRNRTDGLSLGGQTSLMQELNVPTVFNLYASYVRYLLSGKTWRDTLPNREIRVIFSQKSTPVS